MSPAVACAARSPSGPRTIVSWSFVSSRQTAAARSAPQAAARSASVAAGPARRLEQDGSARVPGDLGEPLAPLAAAPGQEPLERPPRPGHAARRDRSQHRRRARDRDAGPTGGRPGRDQPFTRVGDDGRPGVGDQRQIGATGEVLQQLALTDGPAPRVVADGAGRDLVAGQEAPGDPRVLGGDERRRTQHLEGPQRHVAEIADRRGDDVQRPTGAHVRPAWTRVAGAGTGSRRRPSAVRASRSAAPGA